MEKRSKFGVIGKKLLGITCVLFQFANLQYHLFFFVRYFLIEFAFLNFHWSIAAVFAVFGIHNVMRILFILLHFCSSNGGSLNLIKNRVKTAEKFRLAKIKDYPTLSQQDV